MAREADGDVRLDGAVEITGKLGAGIDPASVGASKLGVQAGSSSNDAAVGGVLYKNYTLTGNVGTGDDVLHTYTLPANTLSANGQSITVKCYGFCNGTGVTKTLRFKFGGQTYSYVFSASKIYGWILEAEIIRTGASTQVCVIRLTVDDQSAVTSYSNIYYIYPTATLSSSNAIQITGEATSNDDIAAYVTVVKWSDMNT